MDRGPPRDLSPSGGLSYLRPLRRGCHGHGAPARRRPFSAASGAAPGGFFRLPADHVAAVEIYPAAMPPAGRLPAQLPVEGPLRNLAAAGRRAAAERVLTGVMQSVSGTATA